MGPVERIRALGWVQNEKDAPLEWENEAPTWAKNYCSICATNYCSMRTKIGASSELLIVEDTFFKRAAKWNTRADSHRQVYSNFSEFT